MTTSTKPGAAVRTTRGRRRAASVVAAVIGAASITACGDSAGPEVGAVTTEDIQEFEDRIDDLDERLGVLEDSGALPEDIDDEAPEAVPDVSADFFAESDVYVGKQVTVSAAVSEVVATADAGTAFRIADDSGDPVLVVSTSPPADLNPDDVVRVTGSVLVLRQDTFEQEFGVAPDEVFEDPEAFFGEEEDEVGIAADDVQLLPEEDQG